MAATIHGFELGSANNPNYGPNKASSQVSQVELYGADEEALNRLLRSKIKFALAEFGYDQAAQSKVSELVERNLISCGITLKRDHELSEISRRDLVYAQLADLMSTGFHINSNEVALLILSDGTNRFSYDLAQSIKEASCAVLRDNYSIFPVRIYIARHPQKEVQSSGQNDCFSIALLNVVNTDIGGPGMIQLLDSEVDSVDWEKMIVSAEAWNRTEFHWRKDNHKMADDLDHETLEHDSDLGPSGQDEAQTQEEPLVTIPEIASEKTLETEASMDFDRAAEIASSSDQSRRTSISEMVPLIDHPAMAELAAREANRPGVQHPSWEHSRGGGSLIDLIRAQAAGVNDEAPETEVDEGDMYSAS